MNVLALDTSNYTTSAAVFDGVCGRNESQLLSVPEGARGLRQGEALFQHVKQLPALMARLEQAGLLCDIQAVGASTRPRWVEGSYMPCFLAGESLGRSLAHTLGVEFVPCAHQQGHLAAAAWSAGRMELLDQPFLAWHLSGGTTELLRVQPAGHTVDTTLIGGSRDLSAGQWIDRTGVMLGLSFPAGQGLDALYDQGESGAVFPIRLDGGYFSLSGMENKVKELLQQQETPGNIARFVFDSLSHLLVRATRAAQQAWPGLPVLCSGGVAANRHLRAAMTKQVQAIFAQGQYSVDNAMGAAILTWRSVKGARG